MGFFAENSLQRARYFGRGESVHHPSRQLEIRRIFIFRATDLQHPGLQQFVYCSHYLEPNESDLSARSCKFQIPIYLKIFPCWQVVCILSQRPGVVDFLDGEWSYLF